MNIFKIAALSCYNFLFHIPIRKLLIIHDFDNKRYKVRGKETYTVFRTTKSYINNSHENVVLVVGFRLMIIKNSHLLHHFFQRVCILTTPFWAGLTGFDTKLWAVNFENSNYLGIYQWKGKIDAQKYLDYLIPILRSVSVKGSVWYRIYNDEKLDTFLLQRICS